MACAEAQAETFLQGKRMCACANQDRVLIGRLLAVPPILMSVSSEIILSA